MTNKYHSWSIAFLEKASKSGICIKVCDYQQQCPCYKPFYINLSWDMFVQSLCSFASGDDDAAWSRHADWELSSRLLSQCPPPFPGDQRWQQPHAWAADQRHGQTDGREDERQRSTDRHEFKRETSFRLSRWYINDSIELFDCETTKLSKFVWLQR